jgi:hypothetical protein
MESIFLGCFLFGFLMVVASVALGFAHLALPGLEGGAHAGNGLGHVGHGGAHGHAGHAGGHAEPGAHDGAVHHSLPIWNVSSLLAFLMWFGAGGYAAMQWLDLPALVALLPATALGAAGAVIVSLFLRLVLKGETRMDPRAYRMEGTLARVTAAIPEGGTGEIIFSKAQTRRGEGARSIDGRPIARGEEVVVLDYQRGIALVQRWQDFIADDGREAELAPLPAAGTRHPAPGLAAAPERLEKET